MSALDVRVALVRRWEDHPSPVAFRIGFIRGDGNVWVVESSMSYDGGPWQDAVHVLEFEDGRVVSETVSPGFSA